MEEMGNYNIVAVLLSEVLCGVLVSQPRKLRSVDTKGEVGEKVIKRKRKALHLEREPRRGLPIFQLNTTAFIRNFPACVTSLICVATCITALICVAVGMSQASLPSVQVPTEPTVDMSVEVEEMFSQEPAHYTKNKGISPLGLAPFSVQLQLDFSGCFSI